MIKTIFILITVVSFSVPNKSYSKSYNTSDMPNWIKATIITTFTLSFSKWCWDTFFTNKSNELQYSEADSSSYALSYILTGDTLKKFTRLQDEQERMDFIDQYWKRLDPYPFDEENEMRAEFEERIKYTNEKYSLKKKKGWRTDKGRIYILYGQPDEITIMPFEPSAFKNPHSSEYSDMEIWIYDRSAGISDIPLALSKYTDGRMFFLFARLSGKGRHRQIYSSEIGELNDIGLFK